MEHVRYEVLDPIATITLIRPETLGAWTDRMGREVGTLSRGGHFSRGGGASPPDPAEPEVGPDFPARCTGARPVGFRSAGKGSA
jgi:hypothetical protein